MLQITYIETFRINKFNKFPEYKANILNSSDIYTTGISIRIYNLIMILYTIIQKNF